jgi:uncharacterized protein
MKIYLKELTDQETELEFTQDEPWVLEAVERVDEREIADSALQRNKPPRPIQTDFSLRKVDEVVVMNGSCNTHINLICSRCAGNFEFKTSPHFSGLFCQDPEMAGVGYLKGAGKPAGQNKGFARHAHDFAADESQDLDITYLSGEYIDLGDVLTEQLRLLVPFQPLCKEDCKGICPRCGAELNVGRCACAKLPKNAALSSLQSLNLKLDPKIEKIESQKKI